MVLCEFCEIVKSTYFSEHLWATASLLKVNYFTTNRFFLTITRITFEYEKFHVQISSKNKEFYYLLFHIFESKKKLFQPFLFPIIQCLPLCPKIKSSNQTKLVHCRSISNDQQLLQGLMLASRVEPHCKEGLQFFSVRVFFQEY